MFDLYDGSGKYYFQPRIPHELYWIAISIIVIVFMLLVLKSKPPQRIIRTVSLSVLIISFLLLYCSTVVFRSVNVETGLYLTPFWSYAAIMNGKEQLILENALNIVVFIPFGILCGFVFYQPSMSKAVIVGFVFSLIIEVSQFLFSRGVAEVDDIMHNTLGCVIGYLLWLSIKKIIRYSMSLYR